MQVRLVFEGVYLGHFCAANSTHLEFIEHIFTAPQERILALERRLAPTAMQVSSAATGHPNAPFVARESIVAPVLEGLASYLFQQLETSSSPFLLRRA